MVGRWGRTRQCMVILVLLMWVFLLLLFLFPFFFLWEVGLLEGVYFFASISFVTSFFFAFAVSHRQIRVCDVSCLFLHVYPFSFLDRNHTLLRFLCVCERGALWRLRYDAAHMVRARCLFFVFLVSIFFVLSLTLTLPNVGLALFLFVITDNKRIP